MGLGQRLVEPPPWLRDEGECARRLAAMQRVRGLGDLAAWPPALRVAVNMMLASRFPMFVAWGEALPYLYNDACIPIVGERHPEVFGRPFQEAWADVWDALGPLLARALRGETVYLENLELRLMRGGRLTPAWFTFSYSPLRDEDGVVRGVLSVASETTSEVLSTRRRLFLERLDDEVRTDGDARGIAASAARPRGTAARS